MGGRYYYEKEDDWGHIFLVTEVDFKGILPFPIQLWVFGSDIKPFRSDVIFGTTVLHNSRTRPLLSNAAWILEVAHVAMTYGYLSVYVFWKSLARGSDHRSRDHRNKAEAIILHTIGSGTCSVG